MVKDIMNNVEDALEKEVNTVERTVEKAWRKDPIIIGLLVFLVFATVFQGYQISQLSSGTITATGSLNTANTADQVLAEITPTGTPDYGAGAGVTYDNVEDSLNTLMGYHRTLSLSGDDQDRYIKIATTPNTACEYCCGIGNAGFGRSDGNIACGCSHNLAFSGLTKWMIQNGYSDQQIEDEIQKWKVLFFPKDSLQAALQERGISPESAGLPSMVGGC